MLEDGKDPGKKKKEVEGIWECWKVRVCGTGYRIK